jgi:hypothetical protein
MTATSRPFGNDGLGFIRVRRRKFTGKPDWRSCREREGKPLPTESVSFDLVRAVRIDGKPRHKCVLGLGHLLNVDEYGGYLVNFWLHVISRARRHGLGVEIRRRLADEMIHKGARLPTTAQYEKMWDRYVAHPPNYHEAEMIEIKSWMTGDDSIEIPEPAPFDLQGSIDAINFRAPLSAVARS